MGESRHKQLRTSLIIAAIALVVVAGLASQRYLRSEGPSPVRTPRPSPTVPPAPTPISEVEWRARLADALGSDRVTAVAATSETIAIDWRLAQFPSAGARNDALRRDVANLLRVVQSSHVAYSRLALRASYRFDEEPAETQVLEAIYARRTVDAIDFAAADPGAILRMADTLALDGRFAS
jgi:hypothetical protein